MNHHCLFFMGLNCLERDVSRPQHEDGCIKSQIVHAPPPRRLGSGPRYSDLHAKFCRAAEFAAQIPWPVSATVMALLRRLCISGPRSKAAAGVVALQHDVVLAAAAGLHLAAPHALRLLLDQQLALRLRVHARLLDGLAHVVVEHALCGCLGRLACNGTHLQWHVQSPESTDRARNKLTTDDAVS